MPQGLQLQPEQQARVLPHGGLTTALHPLQEVGGEVDVAAAPGDGHAPRDADDGEGRALARDLLGKLFHADDPLAASSQTIAVMHYLDGMTLEEVAREAGLSVSGVRKRLDTVCARLAKLEGSAPSPGF